MMEKKAAVPTRAPFIPGPDTATLLTSTAPAETTVSPTPTSLVPSRSAAAFTTRVPAALGVNFTARLPSTEMRADTSPIRISAGSVTET